MNTKPILFSEPMVRALLEGRKTQTRRPVKPSNSWFDGNRWEKAYGDAGEFDWPNAWIDPGPSPAGNPGPYLKVARTSSATVHRIYPQWQPLDLLWVRETWCGKANPESGVVEWNEDENTYPVHYQADGEDVVAVDGDGFTQFRKDGSSASPWSPSIHMPRWASRLTLRITDVRVQRVQDISREDVIWEGVEPPRCPKCGYTRGDCHLHMDHHLCGLETPTHEASAFASLWDSLHKDREAWAANPWVWALTFEVLHANVDAVIENRETI